MTVMWVVLLVAGWALVPLPLAVVLGRVFAGADPDPPAEAPEPSPRRTPLRVLTTTP